MKKTKYQINKERIQNKAIIDFIDNIVRNQILKQELKKIGRDNIFVILPIEFREKIKGEEDITGREGFVCNGDTLYGCKVQWFNFLKKISIMARWRNR